jgi:hypothetical protein
VEFRPVIRYAVPCSWWWPAKTANGGRKQPAWCYAATVRSRSPLN